MVPSTTFQENWSGKWPNGPTTSVSNWTVSPTLMRRAPLSWPWHENNRRNCFFQKDTASPLCKLSNQLGRLALRWTIFTMLTLGPTLNYKRGNFVKWKPETHIIAHWLQAKHSLENQKPLDSRGSALMDIMTKHVWEYDGIACPFESSHGPLPNASTAPRNPHNSHRFLHPWVCFRSGIHEPRLHVFSVTSNDLSKSNQQRSNLCKIQLLSLLEINLVISTCQTMRLLPMQPSGRWMQDTPNLQFGRSTTRALHGQTRGSHTRVGNTQMWKWTSRPTLVAARPTSFSVTLASGCDKASRRRCTPLGGHKL